MKRDLQLLALVAMLTLGMGSKAQTVLTLEACRAAALSDNSSLKIAQENVAASEDLKKAALSEFFPKFTANGGYLYTSQNINLLSEAQQQRLSSIGTSAQGKITPMIESLAPTIMATNPTLAAALLQSMAGMNLEGDLNSLGSDIVDDLDMDTRNIFVAGVSAIQPIYLGGKLRELYRLARITNQLNGINYDKSKEDLLISVDEAYWQVVSLQHKEQLAQQYCKLLQDLSDNVDAMLEAEVATRADQTKVRVKLNEAQMSLTKATGGLRLAKLLLCQRCGAELTTNFVVDEGEKITNYAPEENINMGEICSRRYDMQLLDLAEQTANSSVRMAASALKPNILASASYMVTNPNFEDGYAKEFGGTWSVGVVANIPICHPDAIYNLRNAKHKRNAAHLKIEEAREMVELQVNKLNYELEVANTKLTQAESNLSNAEENLKLANESFSTGLISSSDLMAAQTAYISAQSEVIDARIEIRMAYVYLRQALGKRVE